MPPRKIALIGAGSMAREHARAFAALPGVVIAGIQSRTRSRAEALAADYGAPVFDSIDDLWNATHADAVVVTVPPTAVADVATACFAHPWTCLIEKPLGLDLPEALRIEAARTDTPVFVAFNRRHFGATRRLLSELDNTDGPRLITVLDQQSLDAVRAIGHPEAVARNWMYANSIHLVDYFIFLGRGEIERIEVTSPWTPDTPETVMATLHYASGDIGLYQAVWNGPGPWQVTVGTPSARYELRPLERLAIQRAGQRTSEVQDSDQIDTDFKPGLARQASEVLKFLDTGACDLPGIDASTRTMRLVGAIYGLGSPRLPL